MADGRRRTAQAPLTPPVPFPPQHHGTAVQTLGLDVARPWPQPHKGTGMTTASRALGGCAPPWGVGLRSPPCNCPPTRSPTARGSSRRCCRSRFSADSVSTSRLLAASSWVSSSILLRGREGQGMLRHWDGPRMALRTAAGGQSLGQSRAVSGMLPLPHSPALSPWGDPSTRLDARSLPALHSTSPLVVPKDQHRAQAGSIEGTGPGHPPLGHGTAAIIAPVLLLCSCSFLQLPCQLPAPLRLSFGQRRGLLGLTPCQPGLLHGSRVSPQAPTPSPPPDPTTPGLTSCRSWILFSRSS